jgi:hypothetical protein
VCDRIVERAGVRDLLLDHELLVVSRDDQADSGEIASRLAGYVSLAEDRDQGPEQERIAQVGVDDQADGHPEDDFERH